jgi:hypothetical protein
VGRKKFVAWTTVRASKAFCLITMLLVSSLSCGKGDDFEAVRKLVDKGVALGEKHDIGELMNLAAEDFIALPGDLDRRSTRAVLWRAFKHYGTFRIHHPWPSVEVAEDGKGASAGLFFLIAREEVSFPKLKDLPKDPKGWLEGVGEKADLFHLDLELVKEKGGWLVQRATLKRYAVRPFRG